MPATFPQFRHKVDIIKDVYPTKKTTRICVQRSEEQQNLINLHCMFSNRIPVISEQPQLDQKVRGVFSNSSPRDRPSEEYFEQGKDYLA